jgi:hypothetical protein
MERYDGKKKSKNKSREKKKKKKNEPLRNFLKVYYLPEL